MSIPHHPIGKIYSLLTAQPAPVVLLGAGASVKSGVPLAGQVVEKAARWAFPVTSTELETCFTLAMPSGA